MTAFADLHVPGSPLLLPNAWDYASAAVLAATHPAVGTTSLGVAVAAGKPDAAGVTRAENIALAGLMARLPAHVTVDVENGFSEDVGEVAELVAELAELGVAGVNIEDGREDRLVPAEHMAAVVAAVKAAAPEVFVNARTDTHWLKLAPVEETLRRVRAYVDAGADGVFVPALDDEREIETVVKAAGVPVNLVYGRHTPARLASLGVARISTGSLLFRATLHALTTTMAAVADGTVQPSVFPPYGEVAGLV
ncbi:isocitrate lyase/phosphoenolpyruvate mutase family protein [Phytomonospora sp. NPDC050363]|uniref:isocitrate lyase/PEP mutase family protein n=1 Tax=Phytomonospora sp. NPDC050363 TaxID=3155642 RepID=UPI0033E8DCDE